MSLSRLSMLETRSEAIRAAVKNRRMRKQRRPISKIAHRAREPIEAGELIEE
jgi:hypothetical protein